MTATLLYVATVVVCLYGPFVGHEWVGLQGYVLTYEAIPLAIASATQGALHGGLFKRAGWGLLLAMSWAAGCILICVPALSFEDPFKTAVVIGGLLALAALGVILVAAVGALRDPNVCMPARLLYGCALLVYGAAFLRTAVFVMSSASGGIDADGHFRLVVSGGAALVAIAGVLQWSAERRRPTSACS
jgi:hypothetical protein